MKTTTATVEIMPSAANRVVVEVVWACPFCSQQRRRPLVGSFLTATLDEFPEIHSDEHCGQIFQTVGIEAAYQVAKGGGNNETITQP